MMTPWQESGVIFCAIILKFYVNFKCLIGFALVTRKNVNPTPYFEGSKAVKLLL